MLLCDAASKVSMLAAASSMLSEAHLGAWLLRPRWEDGWSTNRQGWVGDVIQKIKRDGRRWSTHLSQEMLDFLLEDVIEDGLETSFRNMAKKFQERRGQTKLTREETLMHHSVCVQP